MHKGQDFIRHEFDEAIAVQQSIVRGAGEQLAMTTLESARQGEPSEVYEAQAVVINAIRKQQDSAGSIIKIARSLKDREMATEAREMQKAAKSTADELAKNLTELAVVIA